MIKVWDNRGGRYRKFRPANRELEPPDYAEAWAKELSEEQSKKDEEGEVWAKEIEEEQSRKSGPAESKTESKPKGTPYAATTYFRGPQGHKSQGLPRSYCCSS